MIAQMVEQVLLPHADAAIDIHSGGKVSVFAPSALINRVPAPLYGANRDLAEAFGLPIIWLLGALNDDRSVNAAAARQGVPMMACELGGAGTVSPAMMALALGGIRRVMAHLGMGSDEATDRDGGAPRYVEVVSPQQSLYAPAGGLFEPCFVPGRWSRDQPGQPGPGGPGRKAGRRRHGRGAVMAKVARRPH
jgi:predicted deacylase